MTPVDTKSPQFRLCIKLGRRGHSTKLICRLTGLRPWEVAYRLKLKGVKRRDYHHGRTPVAFNYINSLREIRELNLVLGRAVRIKQQLNLLEKFVRRTKAA